MHFLTDHIMFHLNQLWKEKCGLKADNFLIYGTFPQTRVSENRESSYIPEKHSDLGNIKQLFFHSLPYLLILSFHSAVASFPTQRWSSISHSRSQRTAACATPWWGRLPVSCQLTLPTSGCPPPSVAPTCESPAGPRNTSVNVKKSPGGIIYS